MPMALTPDDIFNFPGGDSSGPLSPLAGGEARGRRLVSVLEEWRRYCVTYIPRHEYDPSVPSFNISTTYQDRYVMKSLWSNSLATSGKLVRTVHWLYATRTRFSPRNTFLSPRRRPVWHS